MNRLDKAERAYEECRELLRELPIPEFEIILGIHRANLSYIKGNIAEALRIIHNVQMLIRDKGLSLYEDKAFFNEGRFLVRSGAVREGLEILGRAAALAKERNRLGLLSAIALFQAYGYEELNQRDKTLERMTRCLAAVEASHSFQDVLSHRDVLVPLLLRFGDRLPVTDTLSTLILQLRHPGLVKRLLRRSPEGKSYFLRSLNVHDARHFRSYLVTLRNDPEKQVRQASRLILQNWHSHVGYRIYTLGTFRVFLEGKPFIEKDWGRAGIKRLFLFFMTCPEEWQNTEVLLETLWQKSSSYPRSPEALRPLFSNLRSLFEPWHMPDMDYVFFQSRRGAYGFFPGKRFWIDYKEFEKGIKQAEQAQLKRNFTEARKVYREALNLYIGDYLEEFPYEDFLDQKRFYLRELYFRGTMRYAELELTLGNLSEASRVLEDALFKDISRTDCMVLLIQILSRMKYNHEAKEWGEKYIQYMKKKFKEPPSAEVKEVLDQLKSP
jgi:DNA-binding SARP family transcriptional activator